MKFYATPNITVMQRIRNRFNGTFKNSIVCRFDENGELETHDPIIQDILMKRFNGCTWDKEEIEIVNIEKKKHCKKCDFKCDNQGLLLAHYREFHSKEGK